KSISEEFIHEMLFYRKVWGLAHIAVNKCMLHYDHEFVSSIEAYLEKICAKENALQEAAGRPRLAGHGQNVVTHEKSSKKRGQYTCGFCKKPGHNIATCPHKAK
ncbi:8183_t:CDS:2, partial [Racocetra persica]